MRLRVLVVVSLGGIVLGCPSRGQPDAGADAAADAGADARLSDAGVDAFCPRRASMPGLPPPVPTVPTLPTEPIDLDTRTAGCLDGMGSRAQIHPNSVFDGEAIWVAYTAVCAEMSTFDTFATRVALDGSILVPPFQVNTGTSSNDIDPVIAASGTRVLIGWTGDDGSGGTANLQIGYRIFERDGRPVTPDRRVISRYRGAEQTLNHMTSDATFVPGYGFAIAGVRALEAANRFQAFAQLIAEDGTLLDTASPDAEMRSHGNVTVAFHNAARAYLAYEWGDDDESAEAVLWREDCGRRPSSLATGTVPTGMVTAGGRTFVGLGGASALVLELREDGVGAPIALHDDPERNEVAPSLMLGPSGRGAALWVRPRSGTQGRLVFQAFTADGVVGEPRVLVDDGVAPYPPELARIDDTHYAVAYSQGTNPAFRVKLLFVTLP